MMEKFILDTNVFRFLFTMYYEESSPEIFKGFRKLLSEGNIISVKEVKEELKTQNIDECEELLNQEKKIFETPTAEEIMIVRDIFSKPIYKNSVKEKTIREGRHFADPFLVAKGACIENGIVVTTEKPDTNPGKIPNVCETYGVKHLSFQDFMKVL